MKDIYLFDIMKQHCIGK